MLRNFIFDWSGTLVDDFLGVYEAAMVIFEKFGKPRLSLEEFRRKFSLPYLEFYRRHGIFSPKSELDILYGKAVDSLGHPRLHQDARSVLEGLAKMNRSLALFSSDLLVKLEREIDALGLRQYFIAVKADVENKVEEMADFLAECMFRREVTAYIGDMAHDIEAGKKAGLWTIGVTWGFEPRDKIERADPDFIINNLGQLLDISGDVP